MPDDDYRFSIVVKGATLAASKAIWEHFTTWIEDGDQIGMFCVESDDALEHSTVFTLETNRDMTQRLNEWFMEDSDPPFSEGSLLLWNNMEGASQA